MELRNLLAFGTGVGIEIRDRDLEVALVRVRPSRVDVLGRFTIHGFRERPAASWGAEYLQFLRQHGDAHLSATVLLPRREVIVRQLSLPGVPARELDSAVALQMETLHPYGEEEVAAGWCSVGNGAVLAGIMRRNVLEQYLSLFAEAGVAVAAFTFSAGALHGAMRVLGAPPSAGFLAVSHTASGAVELYGESPSRPVFSAEFELPPERAAALALSELRLPPEVQPEALESLLPKPRVNPVENDLSRNALPYATALAGACPRLAPTANLLPAESRAATSRAMYIPAAVLGSLMLLVFGATLAYSAWSDRHYLAQLNAAIAKLEPPVSRAAAIDRAIDRARNRSRLLDQFRGRTRADLDCLNALTELLPPPVWTNSVELSRDAANLAGEAEQAAALLRALDSSPLFRNSEFVAITKTANSEQFRIHTAREAR